MVARRRARAEVGGASWPDGRPLSSASAAYRPDPAPGRVASQSRLDRVPSASRPALVDLKSCLASGEQSVLADRGTPLFTTWQFRIKRLTLIPRLFYYSPITCKNRR